MLQGAVGFQKFSSLERIYRSLYNGEKWGKRRIINNHRKYTLDGVTLCIASIDVGHYFFVFSKQSPNYSWFDDSSVVAGAALSLARIPNLSLFYTCYIVKPTF